MKILKELWKQIRLTFDPAYNDKWGIPHEINNLPVGIKMPYEN